MEENKLYKSEWELHFFLLNLVKFKVELVFNLIHGVCS